MAISQFNGMIKKINEILKRGVVRKNQEYDFKTCFVVNCFGHSVFNFKNEDIIELNSNYQDELNAYFWRFERLSESKHQISPNRLCKRAEEDFIEKVELAGLKIEKCKEDDKLEEGQFKVAFYFDLRPGEEDLHFMRQEENGMWTSKAGANFDVEKFDELPWTYKNNFKLIKTFKITNPYLNNEFEEKE